MKNSIIGFIAALFLPLSVHSQAPESMYQLLINGDIVRWVYSGGDEFSGTRLDRNVWDTQYPWGRNLIGNKEQQYYAQGDSNHYFNNGVLTLVTKAQPVYRRVVDWYADSYIMTDGIPNYRYFPYTSGMLYSKQRYEYGLFEIRFKPSYNSKGLWPAFWLYNGVCKGEIDIFEMKGEMPNKTHYGTVCDLNCDGVGNDCDGEWVAATGNFPDNFNIMRGQWEPNYVAWSLNNQEYAVRFRQYPDPMNVIVNVAVASNNGAFSPGPDATSIFPSNFEIDYVRIWTKVDCNANISLTNYTQGPSDPTVLTGKTITLGSGSIPTASVAINNGQNLAAIGTEQVRILSRFQSRPGSSFWANVAPCPMPIKGLMSEDGSSVGPLKIEQQKRDSKILTNGPKTRSVDQSGQELTEQSVTGPVLYTRVYPNPAQGYVIVEFDGQIDRLVKVELLNSEGRDVFAKEVQDLNTLKIDVSMLSKGVYYLKCTMGDKYVTEKIIINE